MKSIIYLMLALGLILGPGYWIYGKFYSGQTARTLGFSPAEDGIWHSEAFSMDPGMAPLGLILTAEGYFAPNMTDDQVPRDRYKVTLYRQAQALHTFQITLSPGSTANTHPAFKEHLFLLERVEADDYRLEIAPEGAVKMDLSNLKLDIRTGIREPDGSLAAAGVAMLIIAGLLLFLF